MNKPHRTLLPTALAAAVLLALASTPAAAQDNTSGNTTTNAKAKQLQTVIVTGTRSSDRRKRSTIRLSPRGIRRSFRRSRVDPLGQREGEQRVEEEADPVEGAAEGELGIEQIAVLEQQLPLGQPDGVAHE